MKIDPKNNFCRVFELPTTYPAGFCFGGGLHTQFTMVDWFNPIPPQVMWDREVTVDEWKSEFKDDMVDFVKQKIYIKEGRRYIIICDFDESVVFSA